MPWATAMLLKDIPIGVQVHNIELKAGRGGQIVPLRGRCVGPAAGARDGDYAILLLPSGELRS